MTKKASDDLIEQSSQAVHDADALISGAGLMIADSDALLAEHRRMIEGLEDDPKDSPALPVTSQNDR